MNPWATEVLPWEEITWDAIIVGTGMGGATAGHALARRGWRVLFIEQGLMSAQTNADRESGFRGAYAEEQWLSSPLASSEQATLLAYAGRYASELEDRSKRRPRRFVPFIGAGSGGSSALYGMALERFFPADFEPRQHHPRAVDSALPERWPFNYAELAPYYSAAEELYRVRGSVDPLRAETPRHFMAPPALTQTGEALLQSLQARGLHPYRLPMACEFVADCACCQGYLCPRDCKNDATRICLEPALHQYAARMLDRCRVERLEASRHEVTGVVCRREGETLRLRARQVILAAGALETPALLLRSASALWPQGLANDSGQVGRNLMRHCIDLYVLRPVRGLALDQRRKELAFNDFYLMPGGKYGSVQSFGSLPPAPVLLAALIDDVRHVAGPLAAAGMQLTAPLMRRLLQHLFARGPILAATLEDLPYADNRLELANDGRLVLHYRLRTYELQRMEAFRRELLAVLRAWHPRLLKQADNNQRIAHVCGTCRAGNDPHSSVVDARNRAHGLANLHVADASWFPSSGGTNPSLTIAANALRLADSLGRDKA